jgi:hypothetical protein
VAKARTLTLKTKVEVTGADKLRGLGRSMQRAGAIATAGLTVPILGIGAAMITAAEEAEKAQAKLKNTFESMGASSFTTTQALNDQAEALQNATTFDDESITEMQAVMLTFGNVTGDAFDRAIEVGLDMSALLGQDLQTSAIQLGKALNDPIKGITALTRVGVSFTQKQKDVIKALAESGDVAGAQTVILGELERQFGGTAEALAETAGGKMQQALNQMNDAAEEFGKILAPVLLDAASAVKEFAKWLQELNPETKEWVVRIGAATAALGPLLIVVGSLLRAFKTVKESAALLFGPSFLGPIGIAVAAVIVLRDAIKEVTGQTMEEPFLENLLKGTEQGKRALADLKEIAADTGQDWSEVGNEVKAAMDEFGLSWDEAVERVKNGAIEITEAGREAIKESGKQWDTYQAQVSQAFDGPDGAVAITAAGVEAMAHEVGLGPQMMADELLAAQWHLDDAIAELNTFMQEALSPSAEIFQLQGFLNSGELAAGLVSDNPNIRKKAAEMQQAAIDRIAELRGGFFDQGYESGRSYSAGLDAASHDPAILNFISGSAARLAAAARGIFPSSEPKDPSSPLRGITKGFGFGEVLAKGILTGEGAVRSAFQTLAGGGIGMPAVSPATGAAGGAAVVNNFYLQWDGETPKGRSESEIVSNLQRLLPLARGY